MQIDGFAERSSPASSPGRLWRGDLLFYQPDRFSSSKATSITPAETTHGKADSQVSTAIFIICGFGRVGWQRCRSSPPPTAITSPSTPTRRPWKPSRNAAGLVYLGGDASDDDLLIWPASWMPRRVCRHRRRQPNLMIVFHRQTAQPQHPIVCPLPRGAQRRKATQGRRRQRDLAGFHRRHADRFQHDPPPRGVLPGRNAAFRTRCASRGDPGARPLRAAARPALPWRSTMYAAGGKRSRWRPGLQSRPTEFMAGAILVIAMASPLGARMLEARPAGD